jgi:hypothetical protein
VVRNLADWLRRLPSLAEGVPPTTQLHGYSGRWNEIRDAVVDQDGNLTLTIEVVRRHLAEENGDPPDGRVREDLQSKDFEERLECFSGQPRALRGVHEYQQNLAPYSSAVVEYIQVR